MTTLECDFEGFKRMAKEFHDAAPTLNRDELDNAWKCLGLAYFGMNEPKWQKSAEAVLRMEFRTFGDRRFSLMYGDHVLQQLKAKMDEESAIPKEYIEFCKQVSRLAEKHNLSRLSMKITPGLYGPKWGSDINMHWEHGRHGDDAHRINISSEVTVYATVD